MNKPKCHIENCQNEGLLLLGNVFVCGECYAKKKNKIQEAINNILTQA